MVNFIGKPTQCNKWFGIESHNTLNHLTGRPQDKPPLSQTPNTFSLFHLIFLIQSMIRNKPLNVAVYQKQKRRSALARLINNGEALFPLLFNLDRRRALHLLHFHCFIFKCKSGQVNLGRKKDWLNPSQLLCSTSADIYKDTHIQELFIFL